MPTLTSKSNEQLVKLQENAYEESFDMALSNSDDIFQEIRANSTNIKILGCPKYLKFSAAKQIPLFDVASLHISLTSRE